MAYSVDDQARSHCTYFQTHSALHRRFETSCLDAWTLERMGILRPITTCIDTASDLDSAGVPFPSSGSLSLSACLIWVVAIYANVFCVFVALLALLCLGLFLFSFLSRFEAVQRCICVAKVLCVHCAWLGSTLLRAERAFFSWLGLDEGGLGGCLGGVC